MNDDRADAVSAATFQLASVVVVGSTMVDQIAYCDRVPAEGETRRAHRYAQGFGGKGANQAVMAARLGADVAFVGCVGDDAIGRATIDNLAAFGVDTSGVSVISGQSTGVAPIWVDATGSNRILVATGANDALDADRVLEALERRSTNAPVLVLAQLETPQSGSAAAFEWARRVGAVTVLNPAPAAPLERGLARAADWLVPNESEFSALFGAVADHSTIDAARGGGHRMVVTLGSNGALVGASSSDHVACRAAVDVVDTTGAGDAFVGAFCVGLAAGLNPTDAARLGCAAGTLSVGAPGTQTSFPDVDAVLAEFHQQHHSQHETRFP